MSLKRSPLPRGPGPVRKTRINPISSKLRKLIVQDQKKRAETLILGETPCVRCYEVFGFPRNAEEEHHVRTRRIPSTRHAKSNRAALCKPCHDWAHDHGKAFRAWWDSR